MRVNFSEKFGGGGSPRTSSSCWIPLWPVGMGKLDCSLWHQGLNYSIKAALALSVKLGTSDIRDASADTTREVSPLCSKLPHHQPCSPNAATNAYSMTQEGQSAPKMVWVFLGWAAPINLQKHKSRFLVDLKIFVPDTQYSNRAKTASLYFEYLHNILRTKQFGDLCECIWFYSWNLDSCHHSFPPADPPSPSLLSDICYCPH